MNVVAAVMRGPRETAPEPSGRDPPLRGRVSVRHLGVAYAGGIGGPAVADFSLEIEPGEFVCLLGPSGCGKSTVLNAVAGLIRASNGQVFVDGEKVEKPGAERGMVFQQPTLLPWKTVLDNVALGPLLNGHSADEAAQTARSFLALVGLAGYERQYPSQLSGGMQQRVGIVRALANYPRVLLMDEPFSALDAQTRATMHEALLAIWSEFRTTVLFVTHDIDEAVFLGDRVVVMSAAPGRILDVRPVKLPRPRQPEMLFSEPFTGVKRRCFELIRAEAAKGFHKQPGIADVIGARRP
jgi:ABC-type nitrate/sulfonate/bicarbonate transport system ATPase subunit